MKIGILTVSFGEQRFIGACVDQFRGFPFTQHLVLASTKPWRGSAKPDDTAKIAKSLGANVIVKDWQDENTQRNEGFDILKDNDWILIVDADEYYTNRGVGLILDHLQQANETPTIESGQMETYWKTWDWVVRPQLNPPVIAIRPGVRLINIRHFDAPKTKMSKEVVTWHLSYARTDEEIKRKVESWSHSHEIPENWYEDVWLKWNWDSRDFNPTRADLFHEIAERPLPDEIRDRIDKTRKLLYSDK